MYCSNAKIAIYSIPINCNKIKRTPIEKVHTFHVPGTIFTTLRLFRNLRLSAMSQIVTLHQAGKACRLQTLQLIGPIQKLWGK